MVNETSYDSLTILRWITASLRSRGHTYRGRGLQVNVRYNRSRRCSGITYIGGRRIALLLPRDPAKLNPILLAFVIDYLILGHLGVRRRDMTKSQKTEPSELRLWAVGLPLPAFMPLKTTSSPPPEDRRKAKAAQRAKRAANMHEKYELLEAATAKELLRLGDLKKKWAAKVAYYQKRGVL
jgi:hypothetical protein